MVTWPLARDLSHNVAGDFGDPLFNSWALAWDATHLFARGWWNANIFSPQPLTLAYSDHLAAEALQVLPIYWWTGNPILSYNFAILATFVLSGVGMFLLARDLTGSRSAAMVAGLAYAFTPYRIGALSHLTVLSSAWMPFVLLGFRRYFETRHVLPLACACLAWILQNLSSGYYLLFFSPVVVAYLVWEITNRSLWHSARALAAVGAACLAVIAVTTPFVLPYVELRRLGFDSRSLAETQQFSADVYGYLTADIHLWLWGSIFREWPRAEGSLFPGLTVTALAALAVWRTSRPIVFAPLVVLVPLLMGISIRLPGLRIASLSRALMVIAFVALLWLALSRAARRSTAAWLLSPVGFFAMVTAFAIVMSFGPAIHARGRVVLDTNLYALFYRFVPGFDGLRVPARFAMVAALGLAALCAFGLAALRDRASRVVTALAALLVVAETLGLPVPLNLNSSDRDYVRAGLTSLPPLERTAPSIYRSVARLPENAIVLELPLGEPAFDLRYMFFSTTHWKRLVNGYSGGFPDEYQRLDQALQDVLIRPDRTWDVLRETSRPSHIVVHERYFTGDRGAQVTAWVRRHGGREIAVVDSDRLFEMH